MKNKIWYILGAIVIVVVLAAGIYWAMSRGPKYRSPDNGQNVGRNAADSSGQSTDTASTAVQVGKELSNNHCSGTGPGSLSHAAMDNQDFSMIIPYGLMVGGHVTPVDHQYYAPTNYNSARDAYPVYAMGDATLVDIEHRTESPGDNQHVIDNKTDEYRLVFSQTCTFLYYYDLLTSLTPDIKAQFDAASNGQMSASVNIPVKAGQLVGHIGGQTLDFAVWNTEKTLTGFVVPDHYQNERWKIYVADPLDYYTPDLKTAMLAKYPRVDEPLSGKLDWDIDGKLRGSWFLQGSNPGQDNNGSNQTPWAGELSFSPDLYDPSHFVISMGNYGAFGNNNVSAQQFYAKDNTPDPATVGVSNGMVKYQLVTGGYVDSSGKTWNSQSYTKGPKVTEQSTVAGTVLVQLTDNRTLKFESFPGKTGDQVSGFDANAKVYTR